MKGIFAILFLLFGLHSFSQDTLRIALKSKDDFKKLAVVENYEGIYVFTSCIPIAPYEVIGKVRILAGFNYETDKQSFASKTKREFSKADGVIITNLSGDLCYGEAIRFKQRD